MSQEEGVGSDGKPVIVHVSPSDDQSTTMDSLSTSPQPTFGTTNNEHAAVEETNAAAAPRVSPKVSDSSIIHSPAAAAASVAVVHPVSSSSHSILPQSSLAMVQQQNAAANPKTIIRTSDGLGRRQLWAMLRKNWLLKKRSLGQTFCEIFAPILLTLLIVVGHRLASNSATATPPTIYVDKPLDISALISSAGGINSIINLAGGSSSNVGGNTGNTDPLSVSTFIRQLVSYSGPVPVPSFDVFVGAHDLLHSYLLSGNATTLQAVNRLSIADASFNVLVNLGKLSFAPDIPEVHAIVNELSRANRLFNSTFDRIYPDEDSAINVALRDFTQDPDFNPRDPYILRSWAVIVFNAIDLQHGQFDYTIRMNYSSIPSTKLIQQKFEKGYDSTYMKYFLSGYMTLQSSIEQALINVIADQAPGQGLPGDLGLNARETIRNLSATRGSFGSLMTAPMPVSSTLVNPFYDSSGPFVGLVLCLSLLYPVSRLIKLLVEDKESRMKETLKMMGLFNWVFVTSYGITYVIIFFLIAVIQTILMGGSVMSHSSKPLLFIYFFIFGLSMLSLSFLISVFFNKAKLAGIVGPIVSFAFVMPRYAFLTTNDDEQVGAKYFTCILSPTAFAFAMDDYMLYEGAGEGINAKNAGAEPISVSAMIAFMFFDFLAYAFLAWYFEQVLPNEYGSHRPAWFIFTKAYWEETLARKKKKMDYTQLAEQGASVDVVPQEDQDHIEPIRSVDLASKAMLVLSHLKKVFSHGNSLWNKITRKPVSNTTQVIAVNNLSLTMYEGQITCLLGHNGSGKSTTISILSGLYEPTSGTAIVNGNDIRTSMHEIRQNLGVCPQHNVLFDTLTVKDHLELFAVLKGTPAHQIQDAVRDKIAEVGLTEKTDVYSKSLSGGMKRKLSVAIALIGDSKVVFLDEPTSGMDPYSRRSTWELLKRAKQGRVIVLTTHFMDEADLLGDRIAVIAKGRLRALGSSLFLKNKFGVGYNLTLVYQREELPTVVKKNNANELVRANGGSVSNNLLGPAQQKESALMQPLLSAGDASSPALASSQRSHKPKRWTMQQVHAFIRNFVPNAKELSQAGGEISFQLPLDAVSAFAGLFSALDDKKASMGIGAYGVQMTTLEEVFIKIAHEELYREKHAGGDYVRDKVEDQAEKEASSRLHSRLDHDPTSEKQLITVTPAKKKTKIVRRKKVKSSSDIGSSSSDMSDVHFKVHHPDATGEGVEVAAAALPEHTAEEDEFEDVEVEDTDEGEEGAAHEQQKLAIGSSSSPAVPAAAVAAGSSLAVPEPEPESSSILPSPSPSPDAKRVRHIAPMHKQVLELMRKRWLCATRDLWGRFFEVILPVAIVALVLLILTIQYSPAGPSLTMGPALYQKPWANPSPVPASSNNPTPQAATATPMQTFSTHRQEKLSTMNGEHDATDFIALNPIQYFRSTAYAHNDTTARPPNNNDYGALPIAVHGDRIDQGMLYAVGMSNPITPTYDQLVQPFFIDYFPAMNNSYNMSQVLLAQINHHSGRYISSYVFQDLIRWIAPLNDTVIAAFQQAALQALQAQAANNSGFSNITINVPLNFQNIDNVLQLLNITNLDEIVNNGINGTRTFILPANVTAEIEGNELVVSFPNGLGGGSTLPGPTFSINLNDLVTNFTRRINGTNEFIFNPGGLNFTVNAGPDIVSSTVNNLNLTQFLEAVQETYQNRTIPTINIPVTALLDFLNTTSPQNTAYIQQAVESVIGPSVVPVTLLHNVTQFHAIPAFAADLFRAKLTLLYDTVLYHMDPFNQTPQDYSNAAPEYTSSVSYIVRNHPLPLTTQSVLRIRSILAIFAALFVLIPFCYLPASFVIFLVKERNSKAKHLQLVSGVSPFSYWWATYSFDMINYFFVCVAVIIVFLGYSNDSFTGDAGTTFATFFLFLFYGMAVIPMSYCLSFIFQNHTSAQVGISVVLFVLGFVLTIGSFILSNIDLTRDTNNALKPWYRLSPPYCLGEGMINLATRSLQGLVTGTKNTVWDMDVIGRDLLYLVVESAGYFILTMIIELDVLNKGYKMLVNAYHAHMDSSTQREGRKTTELHRVAELQQLKKKNGIAHTPESSSNAATFVPPAMAAVNGSGPLLVPAGSAAVADGAAGGDDKLFISRSPSLSRNHQEHSLSKKHSGSPRANGNGIELGVVEPHQIVSEDEEKQALARKEPSHSMASSLAPPSTATHDVNVELNSSASPIPPVSRNNGGSVSSNSGAADSHSEVDETFHPIEDDDVLYERRRVESGIADNDLIVIKHLRKEFGWDGMINLPFCGKFKLPFTSKPMVAVADLCLSVPAGQCFGFLGINGAGKTTTMSMLTGELEPNGGRAFLNGYDVVTQREDVRHELGYCPQFDPLLDLLTAREHLTLYGRIRGIPEDKLVPLTQHLIEKLGLVPFADNISETYSGGNKRKLSLALALIGDPSVVFLDEPSTGMDPVSRRFMWEIIADLSKSMSIVLTTHSMEECEALCSRIGIMVNGALACLGSLENLKHKYGRGLQVEINTNESRVTEVREFVHNMFTGAEETEYHAGRLKFTIPKQNSDVTLAQIFARIESQKNALGIHDYGVGGASLEQIFVQIAKGNADQKRIADERAKHNDDRERNLKVK